MFDRCIVSRIAGVSDLELYDGWAELLQPDIRSAIASGQVGKELNVRSKTRMHL